MILSELIKHEESLMRFETSSKFSMDFNDYIKLLKVLKEIGEITTNYFNLIKEYDVKLKNENFSKENRKEKLIDFNDKLLNSFIEFNEKNIIFFIDKYNIL